jgi:membrane protein involved in colicin uptake
MSQNLFSENSKKSRRKALVMTILLHIFIVGGFFYTSLDETSDIKSMIDQWLEKEPIEEPVTMI